MPATKIHSCSHVKATLDLYTDLPPHNWLLSNIECYQSEAFSESIYFLTDEELRSGINECDPQFIWGCFCAVPEKFSKEEIMSYDLPELESTYYLRDDLTPQHPLAFLEISVMDSSYTLVLSRDRELLGRLYSLSYGISDEEKSNRQLNRQLRRIRTIINELWPDESPEVCNELQWNCWHDLFRGKDQPDKIGDEKITLSLKINKLKT